VTGNKAARKGGYQTDTAAYEGYVSFCQSHGHVPKKAVPKGRIVDDADLANRTAIYREVVRKGKGQSGQWN
jgi:hypothetical protein